MEKETINNIIADIMINDGPDRHCDGCDVIGDFVQSLLNGRGEEWANKYFETKERHCTAND